jgi:predicted RNA-binding Zn-ribbon protein involved in translation (DUF1610 family)
MNRKDKPSDDDSSAPAYCIECGAELPETSSFCPSCGTEVDTDTESGRRSSKENHPDPERAANKAKGPMKAKVLGQTRKPKKFLSGARSEGDVMLFDDPLISYLDSDEQPEYLLFHPAAGLRIIEPEGNEKTPHHDDRDGLRFLLITDKRLLYVAAHEGKDHSREFSYDSITSVKSHGALLGSPKIEFQVCDGTKYKFAHNRKNAAAMTLTRATEYIKNKIE